MSLDTPKNNIHTLPQGGSARIRPRRLSTQHSNPPTFDTPSKSDNRVEKPETPKPQASTTPIPEPIAPKPLQHEVERQPQPQPQSPPSSQPQVTGIPVQKPQPRPKAERPIPRKIATPPNIRKDKEKTQKTPKVKSDLRPLFFRYIIPVAIIGLFLTGLSLTDPFVRTVVPEYSMEDFYNRTPYQYKGSYSRDFNDLNDIQLTAAVRLGISPAETRQEVANNAKLVPIDCLDVITVDPLTHSQALLVPQANQCLREIGAAFLARLSNDKLPLYRPILTSGTRTREDIGHLRRGNGNASENSTHMYGTTFDISWKRFDKVDSNDPRSLEPDELKHLLAIVLRDLHDRERCYIKHEARQACFHITTRP